MSQHLLAPGKKLIEGLRELGRLLGYHVETEFPVNRDNTRVSQAIDVAWFAEAGQPFPLMIFEVESLPTNSMANNAVKVFAKPNVEFEKPLFYFHVVAARGRESDRVEDLRNMFGGHNYRLYRVGEDEGTSLVNDILAQHRRIRANLPYSHLYELLTGPAWKGLVDARRIVGDSWRSGLARRQALAAYARLCLDGADELDDELAILTGESQALGWEDASNFPSYVGSIWGPLLLCALQIRRAPDESGRKRWTDALLEWQRESAQLPQLTPALHLGGDYAEFLLGLAAALVAAVAASTNGREELLDEFLPVLTGVLGRLEPGWWGFHVALWLLHTSGRFDRHAEYILAKNYIDAAGGVESRVLLTPPSSMSSDAEPSELFGDERGTPEPVPEMEALKERARGRRRPTHPVDGRSLLLRILVDDTFFYQWTDEILDVLWADCLTVHPPNSDGGADG